MNLKGLFLFGLMLFPLCEATEPIINKQKIAQWAIAIKNLASEDLNLVEGLLQNYKCVSEICLSNDRCLKSAEGKKQTQLLRNQLRDIKDKPAVRDCVRTFIELFKSEVRHETLGEMKIVSQQQKKTSHFIFLLMKNLSEQCLECITIQRSK